jgi:ribosomal protein L10
MSKPLKKTMTREYQSLFEDVVGACVVDLTGMDAEAVHELRGQLRQHGMSLRVVKNRIFRQSFREGPLAPLAAHLDGPCAVVTGESVIDVAKELVLATRGFSALTLKDGLIEGDEGITPVKELARMMSLGRGRTWSPCSCHQGGKRPALSWAAAGLPVASSSSSTSWRRERRSGTRRSFHARSRRRTWLERAADWSRGPDGAAAKPPSATGGD